jgi:hypothetical protein
MSARPKDGVTGREGKGESPSTEMNAQRESDSPVVPTKPPNNAGSKAAEVVEGRELAKGNEERPNASRTQRRNNPLCQRE